ncbi:MAG: TVP38/TMEM64 family protein [Thermotogaceae bacterium]|nr:TVP38/TMEM64 family protein [Thermotogaceae bacterium]
MNKIAEKNFLGKWYVIVPMVIFLIFAIFFSFNFNVAKMSDFLQKNENTGYFVCVIVYILLGVTLIPSEPVTLIILAWKGPLIAVLLAVIGNTLAAFAELLIGGSIGDISNFEQKKEKLPFHLGKLPINSPIFLFLARMLPGFGTKFVSLASGVFHVPLFTYLWTTLAANFVGAIFVVFGGYGLINLIKK